MRGEERNDEERAGWWPVRLWLDIIGSSGACMYDVRILPARMNTQKEREIPEPRARIASNISNDEFMTGSYRLR
jgi:hypothetical protein